MSLTTFLTAPHEPATGRPPPIPAAPRSGASQPHFAALLARFAPITLAEMSAVALQDRLDTKFVLSEGQLYDALVALVADYRVLDIHNVRLNRYRTLYYDTADFALFRQHHDGRRNRYKVRARNYVDSRLSFLEVKRKLKRNRTLKDRLPTAALLTRLTPEAGAFLNDVLPFAPDELEPRLWDDYTRITLVSRRDQERLTLDLSLRFACHRHNALPDRAITLPGVAVAEVKQGAHNRHSLFISRMRAMGVRPTKFSKYCAGVALLHEGLRQNNFKPQLRLVNKLIGEACRES